MYKDISYILSLSRNDIHLDNILEI